MSEQEQEECDSCGFEGLELEPTSRPMNQGETFMCCLVCRSTYAANALLYPGQYDASLYATIAWGINYIASQIKSAG